MRHHVTTGGPRMTRSAAQWPALDLLLTRRVGVPLASELCRRFSAQQHALADQRWRELQCAFVATEADPPQPKTAPQDALENAVVNPFLSLKE